MASSAAVVPFFAHSNSRFIGKVIGTKTPKTIKVLVENRIQLQKYPRHLTVRKKYLVHDEKSEAVVGDVVAIACFGRQLSKMKKYELTDVIAKARIFQDPISGKIYTS